MSSLPVSTVRCAHCARRSGRIVNMVFAPESSGVLPIPSRTGSRCGHCGGGLYLEAEEAPTASQVAYLAAIRQASKAQAGPA